MTIIANSPVNSIDSGTINQRTAEKKSNKEKKGLGTGGTVALCASLATLASFGTYLVMKGKSKKFLALLKSELDQARLLKDKYELRLEEFEKTVRDLKRNIRSKDDRIAELNDLLENLRNELTSKKKEIFKLEKELNK